MWNLDVPDALRAQYYWKQLSSGLDLVLEAIDTCTNAVFLDPTAIVETLGTHLVRELDQLILPVVAYEVAVSKEAGHLSGTTSAERYDSFFFGSSEYAPTARAVLVRYPSLRASIDLLVSQTVNAYVEAIQRLDFDWNRLRAEPRLWDKGGVIEIEPLGDSDRHRDGRKVVLFKSASGAKVVYKPSDSLTYKVFQEFVDWVGLPTDIGLYVPRMLYGTEYAWMEFVRHECCKDEASLARYYGRVGVLLATAEALHLTDIHYENIIASGEFPVLVDLETLLQNHSLASESEFAGIGATLLLQPFDSSGDDDVGLYAGLMAPAVRRVHLHLAHPLNDRSEDLEVRYKGVVTSEASKNLPCIDGVQATAHEYVNVVTKGYSYMYRRISEAINRGFQGARWWELAMRSRPRVLVRSTSSYMNLLARRSQPAAMLSSASARAILAEPLSATERYFSSEIDELMSLNIPLFWQNTTERHLRSWSGDCYENIFPQTTLENIAEALGGRSEVKLAKSVATIEASLLSAPTSLVGESG